MQVTEPASTKLRRFLATPTLFVAVPLVLMGAGAGMVSAFARVPQGQIAPGVHVGSLDLGGKTLDEARTALNGWARDREAVKVRLVFDPDTGITRAWNPPASKMGLGYDLKATLEAAARIGHEGVIGQVTHWVEGEKPQQVAVVPSVDTARLRVYLKQIERAVARRPVNARLVFLKGGAFGPRHEKSGIALDSVRSIESIARAWNAYNGVGPRDAGTQVAGGTSPSAGATPQDAQPSAQVDPAIPAQPGSGAQDQGGDTHAASPSSGASSSGESPSREEPVATLETRVIPARITSEDLKQIDGQLGAFTTYYAGTGGNRGDNIALAASHINGTVLRPGEIFSYNKVVGPRDDDNGFKEAPVIEKGKLKPGMGGGVCQVSSTLYNAVLLADLKIVNRTHHAFPVHYLPAGRDATVVYGEIDFQFQNSTDAPIYVAATGRGGRLSFRILGKRTPGRTVNIALANHTVYPAPTETERDPTLPAGRTKVDTPGHNGHRVTVYRIVRDHGAIVQRELISKDHYRTFPNIVLVGTRVKSHARKAMKAVGPGGVVAPANGAGGVPPSLPSTTQPAEPPTR